MQTSKNQIREASDKRQEPADNRHNISDSKQQTSDNKQLTSDRRYLKTSGNRQQTAEQTEQQRSDISHHKGRYPTDRQIDRRADNSLQTLDMGYQTADSRRQQNHKDFSFSNLEPPCESK